MLSAPGSSVGTQCLVNGFEKSPRGGVRVGLIRHSMERSGDAPLDPSAEACDFCGDAVVGPWLWAHTPECEECLQQKVLSGTEIHVEEILL